MHSMLPLVRKQGNPTILSFLTTNYCLKFHNAQFKVTTLISGSGSGHSRPKDIFTLLDKGNLFLYLPHKRCTKMY